MRILAIGDIHGCSRALRELLAAVQLQTEDHIITLGDYVDRGPDSFGVLEQLLALKTKHHWIPLRGNHEIMMLAARENSQKKKDWLLNGGKATLTSYSVLGDAGKLVDVPDHHWEFLETACRDWYETPTHFFVHANAYPDLPLDEQPDYMLFWEPFHDPGPHVSGKTMVCGHTPQKNGLPRNLGHAICIDTWAYGRGWLSCLDVTTGKMWQANQKGQHRTGWIEECALED
ncbi:MAG: serine/threonine protein phosphatase [Planctomycetes bacterium]|nr:serine/threonine protein phosphatase [Planctomycetota bacterium]